MTPFFIEAIINQVRKIRFEMSEDLKWGLMIVGGIALIVCAVMSVTTVVHNKDTPQQYCTTLLGEKTSCD